MNRTFVARSSAGVMALFALCTAAAPAEDAAAIVQRQSAEFSDASASGDVTVIAKYLDDDVVSIDEFGVVAHKKDMIVAGPPTPGVTVKLVQSDFAVQMHGDVAVTSFTDNMTENFHGQTLQVRFRSTEVWLDERGAWKMISSQTIGVNDDPPAVTLPSNVLDEYAGAYSGGAGYTLKISHVGDGLQGSVNGGPSFPILAELRDVLFVPGQPSRRRIVQRDAAGAVVGILSRGDGHDLKLARVS